MSPNFPPEFSQFPHLGIKYHVPNFFKVQGLCEIRQGGIVFPALCPSQWILGLTNVGMGGLAVVAMLGMMPHRLADIKFHLHGPKRRHLDGREIVLADGLEEIFPQGLGKRPVDDAAPDDLLYLFCGHDYFTLSFSDSCQNNVLGKTASLFVLSIASIFAFVKGR